MNSNTINELIKEVPKDIYSQVDIISDAPERFLRVVIDIENEPDSKNKAKIAKDYIEANKALTEIDYLVLISCLENIDSYSYSFWRQLYLIERSIPTRGTVKYTWVDRLKIFADTYRLEHAVIKKPVAGLHSVLRFTKKSGDHEHLVAGPGQNAADFYCWDMSIQNSRGSAKFVEFKHWGSSNIYSAKDFFEDNTKRYGASYVLVFTADHKYYLINYEDNTILEQSELPVPKLLIW